MAAFSILILIVSISVGFSLPTATSEAKCLLNGQRFDYGQSFEDPYSCNKCFCSPSGVACTKIYCPKELSPKRAINNPGVCEYGGVTYKAGEGFKSTDGCNSCGCSENGMVMCTLMACLNLKEHELSPKRAINNPGVCEYGEVTYKAGEGFKSTDGCNSCGCSENGMVMCTLMACLNLKEHVIENAADETHHGCFYNGKWLKYGEYSPDVDGCNTCYCQASIQGQKPYMSCTEMACLLG